MNSLNSSFRSAYNWKARPRSSRKENFTSKWGLSPPDQSIPNSIHFSDRFLAKTLKEKPYFIFNDRLLKKRRPGFTPPIIFVKLVIVFIALMLVGQSESLRKIT